LAIRRIFISDRTGEILHYGKSERFTKKMTEVWRHVYKQDIFTAAEERILNRLADYLQLNTNAIVSPSGDYMNIDQMSKQIGMDKSNMHKTMKTLMKKNAIGMWKSGDITAYYMNPFLFQCGDVPEYLFHQFDDEYHKKKKLEHAERFKAGKKVTSILKATG